MIFKKQVYLLFWLFCFGLGVNGQSLHISGRITAGGEGLGFVSILVKNTGAGTSSNADGYYAITLQPGEYLLEFRYLSYRTEQRKITLSADVQLDIEMFPVAIQLEEVRTYGGDENPAVKIMKNAIAQRNYFTGMRETYRCDAYTKALTRIDEIPKRIMGIKVPDSALSQFMEKGRRGIVYLSETVSELEFTPPRKFHETIKSSVVSGRDFDYSFNQARVLQIDLYENLVLKSVNDRGFVSPFSPAAFTYYSFKLEGAHIEGNYLINRIAVIPRAKNEPLLRGHVYVVDSSWALYGANLYFTADARVDMVDTLRLEQSLNEIKPDVWLPISTRASYHVSVIGVKASGYLLGVFSNYDFDDELDILKEETAPKPSKPKPKRGEVMRIVPEANEKDSMYWTEIRPVPLMMEEMRDYRVTDSIATAMQDSAYRDSIERANNKFRWVDVLVGRKTISWDKSGITIQLQGLAQYRSYNTVEGIALALSPSVTWKYSKTGWITAQPYLRYTFGNHMFHARGVLSWQMNAIKLSTLKLDFGQYPFQFNADEPIGLPENNIYTLFGQNFMKLYLSRFVRMKHSREIANGVMLDLGAAIEDIYPMRNSSDFSFLPPDRVRFTSNNPLDPQNETDPFQEFIIARFSVDLKFKPGQRFVSLPNNRYRIERRNIPQPFIGFTYGTSPTRRDNFQGTYQQLRAGFEWPISLGLAGNLRIYSQAGWFSAGQGQYSNLPFTEHHHFNGNQTVFWNDKPGAFRVLPYYNQLVEGQNIVISSNLQWLQVNAEHKFHGFLLSKIPLLKRLGWEESLGVNYLYSETTLSNVNVRNYYEIGGGIENISFFKNFPGFLAVYFYAGQGGGLMNTRRVLFKFGF